MGSSLVCHKKKLKDSSILPQDSQDIQKKQNDPQHNVNGDELKFQTSSQIPNQITTQLNILHFNIQDVVNYNSCETSVIDNQFDTRRETDLQAEQNRLQIIKEERISSQQSSFPSQGQNPRVLQDMRSQYAQQQEMNRNIDDMGAKLVSTSFAQLAICNDDARSSDSSVDQNDEDKDEDEDGADKVEQHLERNDDVQQDEQDEEYDINYVQGELLQEGKRVVSALNTLNGQLLAVKIYLIEDEDLNLACYNLNRLENLDHTNIHNIISYNLSEDSSSYLMNINVLMPFESGGSIQWLLQKFDKFSPPLAAIFFKQILLGLDYLHQQGLTHQNLKTSNVLVDENAIAKLSDVNILKKYDISQYSAPECFEGGEYSSYADVWSAGCIFIEMLTETNPWQYQYGKDVSLDDIRLLLRQRKYFTLPNIDYPGIQQVLQIIFKKNPEERQTAAQILELEFFKLKTFEPPSLELAQLQQGLNQTTNRFDIFDLIVAQSQTIGKLTKSKQLQNKLKNKLLAKSTQMVITSPYKLVDNQQQRQQMSTSQTNNSITSKSKGGLYKDNPLSPTSYLKRFMDKRNLFGIDLQSSMAQTYNNTHQDTKQVFIKKTHINDIIEEKEYQSKKIISSQEAKKIESNQTITQNAQYDQQRLQNNSIIIKTQESEEIPREKKIKQQSSNVGYTDDTIQSCYEDQKKLQIQIIQEAKIPQHDSPIVENTQEKYELHTQSTKTSDLQKLEELMMLQFYGIVNSGVPKTNDITQIQNFCEFSHSEQSKEIQKTNSSQEAEKIESDQTITQNGQYDQKRLQNNSRIIKTQKSEETPRKSLKLLIKQQSSNVDQIDNTIQSYYQDQNKLQSQIIQEAKIPQHASPIVENTQEKFELHTQSIKTSDLQKLEELMMFQFYGIVNSDVPKTNDVDKIKNLGEFSHSVQSKEIQQPKFQIEQKQDVHSDSPQQIYNRQKTLSQNRKVSMEKKLKLQTKNLQLIPKEQSSDQGISHFIQEQISLTSNLYKTHGKLFECVEFDF